MADVFPIFEKVTMTHGGSEKYIGNIHYLGAVVSADILCLTCRKRAKFGDRLAEENHGSPATRRQMHEWAEKHVCEGPPDA